VVGIRSLGDYPCPRCLVALTDVHNMGTPHDLALREEQRRKDDTERRRKIDSARKIIFKQNYSVNTDEVEKLLKPTSLVPSRVSSTQLDLICLTHPMIAPFFYGAH
jgi:hypothetical protein